jgi:hypothetical protein
MANDKIHNEDRASQIHKFEGMGLMRNIVPTDIDIFGGVNLFTEYNGRLFILGEGKYMGAEMTRAQKQAFVGLCNAISESPNHVMWILLYRHEVHDTDVPVYVKDQYVTDTYNSVDLEWKKPTDIGVIPNFETIDRKITMKQAMKQIEKWCIDNCKYKI